MRLFPQEINFTGKLEECNGVTMFLVTENQEKIFKLFCRHINHNRIMEALKLQKILNLLNEASNSRFVRRR